MYFLHISDGIPFRAVPPLGLLLSASCEAGAGYSLSLSKGEYNIKAKHEIPFSVLLSFCVFLCISITIQMGLQLDSKNKDRMSFFPGGYRHVVNWALEQFIKILCETGVEIEESARQWGPLVGDEGLI